MARMVNAIRAPIVVARQAVSVGASLGIAVAPDASSDAATLTQLADAAMYAMKSRHAPVAHASGAREFDARTIQPQVDRQLQFLRVACDAERHASVSGGTTVANSLRAACPGHTDRLGDKNREAPAL